MARVLLARTLVAVLAFSWLAHGQSNAPPAQHLTLTEAVGVALEKNPTVHAAAAYSQAVHQGIAEAKAGLATITDLLEVETAHTSAQKNYLNDLFDYRRSYTALELATGELAPDSPAVKGM